MLDAHDSPSTPAATTVPLPAPATSMAGATPASRPPKPPLPRRRELRQQPTAKRRSHRPRHRVEPPRRPAGQAAIRVGAPMTAAGLVASSLLAPTAAAAIGSSLVAARADASPGPGAATQRTAAGQAGPAADGHPGSSVTATAIGYAMAMLGKPYVWGGSDPAAGFDCSGLILSAYRYAGLALPRTAAQQYLSATGSRLSLAQAQPGDLVFWGTDPHRGGSVYHVAMYASPGMVISAPSTGSVVQIQRMWTNQLMPLVVRPAPDAAGLLPVRPGSSGWSVTDLQHRLRNNGYAVRVTGVFDQQTLAAVQQLQTVLGVVRDPVSPSAGPVGPAVTPVSAPPGPRPSARASAAAPSTPAAPVTPPSPTGAVAPAASPSVSLESVAGVTVIEVSGADSGPAAAPNGSHQPTPSAPARPPLPPLPPLSSAAAPRTPANPLTPATPAPPAAPAAAAPAPATQPPVTPPTATAVPGEVGPQTWQWLISHGNKTSVS